jgi:hypothetical protein
MSERVDIGHGVKILACHHPIEAGPDLAGELAGFDYWHPCGSQAEAAGYVPVAGPGDKWTVESVDPLTLSPSLLCRACGHHGFIRGGRWVPA